LPFFIASRGRLFGKPIRDHQVQRLRQLRNELGWVNRGSHHAPRIHDLRHTFVVRRILLWHEQGVDVDERMLALSTYVGHVKVSNTYWYLQAVPELMAVAKRFERACRSSAMSKPPRLRKGSPPSFAALVQRSSPSTWWQQRALSPRTVAATATASCCSWTSRGAPGQAPTAMQLTDITPALILAFLDHLERERHNAVRSRNLRLAALRAFLKFAGAAT
jgi:integrase